jgi:hypothetical protein
VCVKSYQLNILTMPELTDLQEQILNVIEEHSERLPDLFNSERVCRLTSEQIFSLMKIKPNHVNYINRLLNSLKMKDKIKTVRKQTPEGLKRFIILL